MFDDMNDETICVKFRSDCQKRNPPRIETVLQNRSTVLKFQFHCACFRGADVGENFSGNVEKKKNGRKRDRIEHAY